MRRSPYEAVCTGYGRIASFGAQSTRIHTGGSDWLKTDGPIGPRPVSEAAADLLDIAVVIYRSERLLPKRATSNPNVRYKLTMPVANPDLWRGRPADLLQDILGFLGNAEWELKFVQRPRHARKFSDSAHLERPVTRVALLSGGLDSTCGVGSGLVSASDTQLCSFYTRQMTLQREIALELGFPAPTQWRQKAPAGAGRSFYYRSFLFLALAAATADTWSACEIVQFENGILASAIPPVPSLAMTRHAHPRLHQLFTELLCSVLGGQWRIVNPLWQMTKAQAVQELERQIGAKRAARLTAATQSCWNLSAPHVFGIRNLGRYSKHVNEHCGVCVPCIVRRTALPREHVAFDLRRDAVRNHPKLGAHFMEYAELLSAVRAATTTADLRIILPAEALDLIDYDWTDLSSLERLLRKFAAEFFKTFF